MDRRQFLQSCACMSGATLILGPSLAQAPSRRFVCTTPDSFLRQDELPSDPISPGSQPSGATQPVTPADVDFRPTPYGTAFRKNCWLSTDGLTPSSDKITLGVFFMAGDQATQQRVIDGANRWLQGNIPKKIAFDFSASQEKSHIRITFDSGIGSFSLVGRENLFAPKTKRTMNLEDPYSPTIEHEFGHALGLEHEHMFPGAVRWNPEKVIADMLDYKWSPKTTTEQILQRLPATTACVGDPKFNKDSVMMYPVLEGWGEYKDDNGVWRELISAGGKNIHPRDLACIRGLYNI